MKEYKPEKIGFKDINIGLKIPIVTAWFITIAYGIIFLISFISEMLV